MIYPTIGISMFAHIAIVTAEKIKSFAGFRKKDFSVAQKARKEGITKKIFLSFCIALIIEVVMISAIGTSFFAIYLGITGNRSNISEMENIYKYETQKHYFPDALNINIQNLKA